MEYFNLFGCDLTNLPEFIKSKSSGSTTVSLFSPLTPSFNLTGLLFIPETQSYAYLHTPISPINTLISLPKPDEPVDYHTSSEPSINELFPFYNEKMLEPYSIRCSICYKKSTDYFKLDCSHSFCTSCLRLYFNSIIDSFKLKSKYRLCPECESPIKKTDFFGLLSEEDLLKYEKYKIKKKGMTLVLKKYALFCPKSDCPGYGYVFHDQDTTACICCKCTLCLLCGKESHPLLKCEENDETEKDSEFNEFLVEMGWKKCPVCGAPVEKIDGCQFLTCTSQACNSEFHFCNICGKSLTIEVHFGHFETEGVYGSTCNTLEGLPDSLD